MSARQKPITLSTEEIKPGKGDKEILRYIVHARSVGTSDEEIMEIVKHRFVKLAKKSRVQHSEATIKNWIDAALKLHHENQKNYNKIMSGDFT